MYLRAKDYFTDFEKVYSASRVLPSLDGTGHFRLRKSMSPAYSLGRLEGQLDQLYHHAREYMANWTVGDSYSATPMCRRMIIAQISPLSVSVDSQDLIDDLMRYKERALLTHIVKVLPKFMLNTSGMQRRSKAIETLLERVQNVHTPAPAGRKSAGPCGRHSKPAHERPTVLARVESPLRAFSSADCQRVPKLKPRWDVHMAGGEERDGGYAGAPLLLIAGWSGSAA